MTTFVLVHGAWGRSDDWDEVVAAIGSRGDCAVADLPTCHAGTATLADDLAHVQGLVAAATDDVVLVGHSYGGLVITGVDAPNVRHLVYVAAFMLDETETVSGVMTAEPAREDWLDFRADGMCDVKVDVEADRRSYSAAAFQRLQDRPRRSWAFMAGVTPPPHVAWRSTPASYVVATRDSVLTPTLQETFAARAGSRHEFAVEHAVMFEVPDELAEIIASV